MKRFFISFVIISLGIAGAYLVISKPDSSLSGISFNTQSPEEQNNPTNDFPVIPIQKTASQTASGNQSSNNLSTEDSSQNLTVVAMKEITDTLSSQNPNGPELIDGQKWLNAADPENLADNIVKKAIENFNPAALRPIIDEKDLRISDNNDKEFIVNYLMSFSDIVKTIAGRIQSKKITDVSAISPETIDLIIDAYQSGFDALLKLQVPSSFLSMHRKELELLGTDINIYKKVKDYQEDPVATVLATQELEQVESEFKELKEEIINTVKRLGILS